MKSLLGLALGLAVGCAGCSSESPAPALLETETSNAQPLLQRVPVVNGWFGGLGCSTHCEVIFSVDGITPNARCDEAAPPLGPDEQLLRFDLSVEPDAVKFSHGVNTALMLENWSVSEGNEETTVTDLHLYLECGKGTDAITKPIVPGADAKISAVIGVPKSAQYLELTHENVIWMWPIDPA